MHLIVISDVTPFTHIIVMYVIYATFSFFALCALMNGDRVKHFYSHVFNVAILSIKLEPLHKVGCKCAVVNYIT